MDSFSVTLAREPYRLFFPLAVLAGVAGVALWPLLYAGWLPFYPADAHARILAQGFTGGFVLGFLGTALPRLIGSPPLTRPEVFATAGLWLTGLAAHLVNATAAGDILFAIAVAGFAHCLAARWFFLRSDVPPPGFPTALLGVAGALGAALVLAAGRVVEFSSFTTAFCKLLLYQGFGLLPMIGVAPYLLPRFFGRRSDHAFDEAMAPPPGWWPRALAALAAGLVLVATFAVEAAGHAAAGQWARAGVLLLWFALQSPVLWPAVTGTTPGTVLRWAALSMVAGLALAAAFPFARVGSLHLVFVSGLGLAMLGVGTRVVLGHAGCHDLLGGKIVWLRWVFALGLIAAATRVTADFVVKIKVSHHIYAAATWIALGLIWLWVLRRALRTVAPDED
jgi:uncharacterized protein involved in response to NO